MVEMTQLYNSDECQAKVINADVPATAWTSPKMHSAVSSALNRIKGPAYVNPSPPWIYVIADNRFNFESSIIQISENTGSITHWKFAFAYNKPKLLMMTKLRAATTDSNAQEVIQSHGAQEWGYTWTIPWTMENAFSDQFPFALGTYTVHIIMQSKIFVHGVVVADGPWTSIDDIQSAFEYQPKMPREQSEEKTKEADESYWTSLHADLPWTMHSVENEEVILPVSTFEKKKKHKSKTLDHNDDVGDMDDFFRMAHEEAMLETMSQGLVRGDKSFYI